MLWWDADPIAFNLGPLAIHWYGLLFSGGFVIGYFIMQLMFRRRGYNTNDLDKLLVFIFAGTVIGARLAHCFIYEPDFYLNNPGEILKIWHGGLASHGGTVGVLLAIWLFVRKRRYSFLEIADMLCVPVALVSTLIRLGNFMNSEIVGIPTQGDFGVIFMRLGEDFPRYPAQLFEAAAYFAIFIILTVLYFLYKRRPQGFILGLLFVLIFTSRLVIEPFKVEQADYATGIALNVGQLLSLPFILLGLIIIGYAFYRKRQAAAYLNNKENKA